VERLTPEEIMLSKTNPKQRALVIGLIILGILFTLFFGMRVFHALKKFGGHGPPPHGKIETDVELIRDWMTISFIARTYRVPEKDMFDALKISPLGSHNKSLKELNNDYYPDKDGFVMDTVKTAILAFQASHPPPPDSAPTTVSTPTALAPVTP
jgi:hypothetical protein